MFLALGRPPKLQEEGETFVSWYTGLFVSSGPAFPIVPLPLKLMDSQRFGVGPFWWQTERPTHSGSELWFKKQAAFKSFSLDTFFGCLCAGSRLRYVYPGASCSLAEGGQSYAGLCSMGSCHSMAYTCAVDVTRDFAGAAWRASRRRETRLAAVF